MAQTQSLINFAEGRLSRCIQQKCRQICSQKKEGEVCEGRDIPNAECESRSNLCLAQKNKIEELKQHSKNVQEAQQMAENNKDKKVGNSALAKAKKQKEDTDLYTIMGYGATAYLGYKSYKYATQCSSTNKGACVKTGVYAALAAAALNQTKKMGSKADDLDQTVADLCVDQESCGQPAGAPSIQMPCFGDTPAEFCGPEMYTTLNPPKPECPPAEPNCDKKSPDSGPNMPGANDDPKFDLKSGALAGDSYSLGKAFEPEGGWPNGENPFKSEAFDYKKMSPSQKKEADKIMADLNKEQQAFMAQHGLGDDSVEELGSTGGLDSSGAKAGDLSPAFQKMADDSRALAGLEDSPVRRRKKPTSLAEQMKNMLKKMHGGKDGAGFLGDKSVSIGSDKVGVREDNIFHMVHRMNRKLEGNDRFISAISF